MTERVEQALRDLIAYENRPLDEGPMDEVLQTLLNRLR